VSEILESATVAGRLIEEESFRLIERELGAHSFSLAEWQVVRRVIHATADLEFARALVFSPGAVQAGAEALRRGSAIVCDVQMVAAGLSRERLAAFGCDVACFVGDDDVALAARAANSTRAAEAMHKAERLGLLGGAVVAIGNAPTALTALARLMRDEAARPALVLGVPVGFVNAVEAKEAALALPAARIIARGRKGGSSVAAAIVNALLVLAAEDPS